MSVVAASDAAILALAIAKLRKSALAGEQGVRLIKKAMKAYERGELPLSDLRQAVSHNHNRLLTRFLPGAGAAGFGLGPYVLRDSFDPASVPGLFLNVDANLGITLGAASSFGGFESAFDNAYWSKSGTTIGIDADGISDNIIEDTGNTTHLVTRSGPTNFGPNAYTQCLRVLAKMNGRRWLRVSGNTGASRGWFDLQNGVVGTSAAATVTMVPCDGRADPHFAGEFLPNLPGYYDCAIAYQATDTDIRFALSNADFVGASPIYVGDGASGILFRDARLLQQRVNTLADQETVLGTNDFIQATVARQAAYRTDLALKSVDFDGVASSDFMTSGAAADFKFMSDGTGGYVFAVFAYLTGHAGNAPLLDNCNQTGANVGFFLSGDATNTRANFAIVNGAGSAVSLSSANGSMVADVAALVSAGYFEDGGAAEAFIRFNRAYPAGSPAASALAPSASNPTSILAMGARAGGTTNAKVRVHQILMYKRTGGAKMTQTEIDYIENGLRAKWGTP